MLIEAFSNYLIDPKHVIPTQVCALLGHPMRPGSCMCLCGQTLHMASGQVIEKTELVTTTTMECLKAPDGKHCWHNITPLSVCFIPGGSTQGADICCWCGKMREYEIKPSASYTYSYNQADHGPHAPKYHVVNNNQPPFYVD